MGARLGQHLSRRRGEGEGVPQTSLVRRAGGRTRRSQRNLWPRLRRPRARQCRRPRRDLPHRARERCERQPGCRPTRAAHRLHARRGIHYLRNDDPPARGHAEAGLGQGNREVCARPRLYDENTLNSAARGRRTRQPARVPHRSIGLQEMVGRRQGRGCAVDGGRAGTMARGGSDHIGNEPALPGQQPGPTTTTGLRFSGVEWYTPWYGLGAHTLTGGGFDPYSKHIDDRVWSPYYHPSQLLRVVIKAPTRR